MKNESVAVLDVRSYEVTFLLGGKGVNGTFVFRGSKSERYEGYTADGFLDEASLKRAINACISSVLQNYDGNIKEVFVGVPAFFVKVLTKGQTIAFPTKRKIAGESFDALFDAGFAELSENGRLIERSAMYYSVGDNRKYFSAESLGGTSASLLKGGLCYYFVDDAFYSLIAPLLEEFGFEKISFVPSSLAQAMYLLPKKEREGYAFLLDVGFLSSSVSVVYGNGIVHEEAFEFGTGRILLLLMDTFDVDYDKACEILSSANISGGTVSSGLTWTDSDGNAYSVAKINEIVKFGLDAVCERVDAFFARYYKDKSVPGFALNPLCVTGEGIGRINGGAEHISKRLGRLTEVVKPDIPYYDKPAYSSRIAVLASALSVKKETRGLKKLFNIFGGKKK